MVSDNGIGMPENVSVGRSDERFNFALIRTLELENMLDLAEVITMGAQITGPDGWTVEKIATDNLINQAHYHG